MPTHTELEQFVEKIKEGLAPRLDAVSIQLFDAGLMAGKEPDEYYLVGWARRIITGHTVQFHHRVVADIRNTRAEDVEGYVAKLQKEIMDYFYSGAPRIITLH